MSTIYLATRSIVRTVTFPQGSRPWMLRASPDGKVVWVQTGVANTNLVLDSGHPAMSPIRRCQQR
ncbi:MAG: hypothetical protein M3069_02790 [Chloroflexota bacterium]|nr:hypothetical protein [Chloroflexota bacterium]